MVNEYFIRADCGGMEPPNTGRGKCPYKFEETKYIIISENPDVFPNGISYEEVMKLIHADRPERAYVIGVISGLEITGGEPEYNQNGVWGPNNLKGYTPRVDKVTFEEYDQGVKANLMKFKNRKFWAVYIDKENLLAGENSGDGKFIGIEMKGISVGGKNMKTSDDAILTADLSFADTERYYKNERYRPAGFNISSNLNSLIYVDVVKVPSSTNEWKIKDHYGDNDLTGFYKDTLINAACWKNAMLPTYNMNNNTFVITGTNPRLMSPSVLYEHDAFGIEQF